ncbi:Peroxidase 17-like protein [Drosera capensis]
MLLIPLLILPLLLTTTATVIAAATTTSPLSLRPGFYSETCPEAEATVRRVIKDAMIREPRSGASVMRLQFHDCFVNGCDGSVLLDDTPDMLGEKLGLSNINSLRSFEVIDEAREALERVCPQTVSCADLVIMAARDAVALSGGPDWEVKLGRKDSLTASQEDSDNIMPSPRANASYLVDLFHRFNLSVKDLVALSGSHSIGEGRCFSIVFRLYNQSGSGKPDPEMDPIYREKLDRLCPTTGDQNVTGGLDMTPTLFDNQYFKDLVLKKGFLNSDQTLHTFEQTRAWVEKFSEDQGAFFEAFVEGMVKMGDLQSGRPGEIRRNCRVVNKPHIAHWDF